MKFAPILAALLTIFALNAGAHTSSHSVCFDAGKGATGKIELTAKEVTINWDVDDFTEASKEKGAVRNYNLTPAETSGEALMENSNDEGTVWISISKGDVIFLEASQHGAVAKNPDDKKRVVCPKDASPLELAD